MNINKNLPSLVRLVLQLYVLKEMCIDCILSLTHKPKVQCISAVYSCDFGIIYIMYLVFNKFQVFLKV